MFHFTLKDFIKQSLIASLYVVLVLAFMPISFREIQFRVAEILLVVVLFDKKAIVGITLGTFIANLTSPGPLLPFDLTLGVLATFLSVVSIGYIKNIYIGLLAPTIFNGLLVGLSLYLALEVPLIFGITTVAFGEFVVTYVIGLPLFKILNRNSGFKALFED